MPWPASTYQAPDGVTPAFFQSSSSFLWVPESSPRETNGNSRWLIWRRASAPAVADVMPAGSSLGPAITKSFQKTGTRATPWPSATNFFSAAGAWTSTMSTSPFWPWVSACPVPVATYST